METLAIPYFKIIMKNIFKRSASWSFMKHCEVSLGTPVGSAAGKGCGTPCILVFFLSFCHAGSLRVPTVASETAYITSDTQAVDDTKK